jgi:glucose/mannose transport system substrate-binding protein
MSRWVKMLALFGVLGMLLAACGGTAPAAGPTTAPAAPAAEAPTAAPAAEAPTAAPAAAAPTAAPAAEAPTAASAAGTAGGKLEIFSWWTNGGEQEGLNAMFDIYKKQDAGVEIVNATVAGGAGTNAKAVLQTRLAGGQPPDSWQVHAGREALSYVNAGQLEPLTKFFTEQGFDKNMPKFLLDQLKINGEIYTVPVNIHRSNVMWYNIKLFKDNGLEPPKTMDDFFKVAEAFKSKGVQPFVMGGSNKFEASHTFESILLATYGPDDYVKLWDGTTTMWDDPRAAQAIATFKKLLGYANSDRTAIGWADAMDQVINGKAAMTIMGDWAHGYAISKGKKVNVDYGWIPSPGTEGSFIWLSDSFGLAKGAPDAEQAKAWLAVCGSKEGQDAFNPKKGSSPARTDADLSKYDDYLKAAIKDFGSLKLAPSATHGASTTNAYQDPWHNLAEVFSSDLDEKAFLQGLKDAAPDNLK